ncbi:MAG: DrmB family protein [Deltaproteobacteria bacterium]
MGTAAAAPPPDGKLRLSQAVSTFGPGSLVDLIDDAVLVYGLDFWRFRDKRPRLVQEPRLRDDLAEQLAALGMRLSQEAAFREPPSLSDERDAAKDHGIPVLEFPRWFVCQNARCRALLQGSELERKGRSYAHQCEDRREGRFVPVRFVVACRKGHLDEFPWVHFVHPQGQRCPAPRLRLGEGKTGDFAELTAECVCGVRRRLIDAAVQGALPSCQGRRPWLGREGGEKCDERLRLLVRTASNGYFPQVVSALSIPEKGFGLREAVQSTWDILGHADAKSLPVFRSIPKVSEALAGYADEAVLGAIGALQKGLPTAREPLRTAEFRRIIAAPAERPGELPAAGDLFFAREAWADGGLPTGVAKLVLLPKLREVRAQVGFTRIEAASADLQGEFDLGVQISPLGLQTDWLPAHEVRGEGIFIQLDEAAVGRWEAQPSVVAQGRKLLSGYEQWSRQTSAAPPFPGVRFWTLGPESNPAEGTDLNP